MNGGGAFVEDESSTFPLGGKFVKFGVSWKLLNYDVSPILSINGGKAFLDVQKSTPPYLLFSDRATIFFILADTEWQLNDGLVFLFRIGERYYKRDYKKDQY